MGKVILVKVVNAVAILGIWLLFSPVAVADYDQAEPIEVPCHKYDRDYVQGFFLSHMSSDQKPIMVFVGEMSPIEYNAFFPDETDPVGTTVRIHGWVDCLKQTIQDIYDCFDQSNVDPRDFVTCVDQPRV